MFDYVAWLRRLEVFVAGRREIAPRESREHFRFVSQPPLDEAGLSRLRDQFDLRLPACIERFLTQASSGFTFQYLLHPGTPRQEEVGTGEIGMLPVSALPDCRKACKYIVTGSSSWISSDDPLVRAFWFHALPLTDMEADNGDGLALWAYDPNLESPPVLWLSHDDGGVVLAKSFDEFLETWEYFGYVAPRALAALCGEGLIAYPYSQAGRLLRREMGLEE